jgi:hypothetical protein
MSMWTLGGLLSIATLGEMMAGSPGDMRVVWALSPGGKWSV